MNANRRAIVLGSFGAMLASGVRAAAPNEPTPSLRTGTTKAFTTPVIWVLPAETKATTRLVIWLGGGISKMESTLPMLERLAREGFAAVSFDSWERGSRLTEPAESFVPKAFANFPMAWPVYANGAMESLRVFDWAAKEFGLKPPFSIGGFSAGGDIAIAAAGLDSRIQCVATIVSTPDWTRPGMHLQGKLVASGEPDAYARYLYDRINPLTNLKSYAHRPAMTLECGEKDDHVPADGALRFQAALAPIYGDAKSRLRVNVHPGVGHGASSAMFDNCVSWFKEYA